MVQKMSTSLAIWKFEEQMWSDTKDHNVNQRTSEVILTAKDKLLKTQRESLKLLLLRDMND